MSMFGIGLLSHFHLDKSLFHHNSKVLLSKTSLSLEYFDPREVFPDIFCSISFLCLAVSLFNFIESQTLRIKHEMITLHDHELIPR